MDVQAMIAGLTLSREWPDFASGFAWWFGDADDIVDAPNRLFNGCLWSPADSGFLAELL